MNSILTLFTLLIQWMKEFTFHEMTHTENKVKCKQCVYVYKWGVKFMLNDKQMKIVKTNEKAIFVVSGAGTGKTTVIYNRILYLLSKKVDPKSILAISFTRRTVNDLKNRFLTVADNPVIKTFHGLAFSHVGCENSKVLMDPSCDLFDQFDIKTINEITTKKGVLTFKNTVTKPLSVYNTILTKNGLYDYADLEIMFFHYLKELGDNISSILPYSYIFIDESQDLSFIQVEILKCMIKPTTFVCFVGDPDQSIYSFRGSTQNMVSQLIRTFSCSVYTLDDTYRCVKSIVDAANNLIKHNHGRIPKVLKAHRNEVGIIEYHQFSNTKKEAHFIFSKIRDFLTKKYLKKDIILLVRNHFQCNEIKRLLQSSYYEGVDCLSIHQSKGLEYPIVFIIGIENKKFKNRKEMEEERRLFFVGMTRAKDILIMTSPEVHKTPKFIRETKVVVTKH